MRKFLKGAILGLVLSVSFCTVSAYATKNSSIRSEASAIYQSIKENADKHGGKIKYNATLSRIHDYLYTDDIPECLHNCIVDIYKNVHSEDSVLVLRPYCCGYDNSDLDSNVRFALASLEDIIIRGDYDRTMCETEKVEYFIKSDNKKLLIRINEEFKELVREVLPEWNPNVFGLS